MQLSASDLRISDGASTRGNGGWVPELADLAEVLERERGFPPNCASLTSRTNAAARRRSTGATEEERDPCCARRQVSEEPTYLYDRELNVDVQCRVVDGDPEERSRPDRRQEPAEERVKSLDEDWILA